MDVKIIVYADYEKLMVDGVVVAEAHRLDSEDVLRGLGIKYQCVWCDEDPFED